MDPDNSAASKDPETAAAFRNARSRWDLLAGALLAIAPLLWLTSLGLPAVTSYADASGIYGLMIALVGWVFPAWWANLFIGAGFLLALRGHGRTAIAAFWLAVGLSFTTFFIDDLLLKGWPDHGGPIFGLGLGGLLWLAAIQLFAISGSIVAALRNPAANRLPNSIALIVVFVLSMGSVALIASVQRTAANAVDARYFSGSASPRTFLKLGPVCKEDQPSPRAIGQTAVILGMSPPYNLAGEARSGSPVFLFRSGVGALVFGKYQIDVTDPTAGVLMVRPPSRSPSVMLAVEDVARKVFVRTVGGTRVKLTTVEATPQVREFTWWRQEGASHHTCPRMRLSDSDRGTSLERFVVEALGDASKGNMVPVVQAVTLEITKLPGERIQEDAPRPDFFSASCKGQVTYRKDLQPRELESMNLGALGPLRVSGSDALYYITLFDAGAHQVRIGCDSRFIAVAADMAYQKSIDVMLIDRASMKVRKWLRIDAPRIDERTSGWRMEEVEILGSNIRISVRSFSGVLAHILISSGT